MVDGGPLQRGTAQVCPWPLIPHWRGCRNSKEAVNIVIPAKAGIQCYQVLSGFRVKPGMTGGGIIQSVSRPPPRPLQRGTLEVRHLSLAPCPTLAGVARRAGGGRFSH